MPISTKMRQTPFLWLLVIASLAVWQPVRADGPADDRIFDTPFVSQADGSSQRYVLVLPAALDPEQRHDVLIALHGHGSDRWQFVKDPRDECRAARDVAARRQMLFISPDYRARTSWMGPLAEQDVVQIIAAVKTEYRVNGVYLCGGSMGGTASLTFAALHPDLIAGVASMNGTANLLEYENFQDAIQASFGGSKVEIPEEYKRRSAEYWPEKLTMPVGLTASGQDTSVPPGSVIRLARVLQILQRKVLLVYREEMGHTTSYDDAVAILEFVVQQ